VQTVSSIVGYTNIPSRIVCAWSAVSGEDRTFSVQNARGEDRAADHDPVWAQSIQLADGFSQRPATVTDNDFLLALFTESRPDLALLPEQVRADLIRMQFDSQLAQYRASAPAAVDWILELDDGYGPQPVGRCYLDQGPAGHRLLDVAIRPDRRGRGLGSAVLRRLCADAGRAGVPLRLTVWQGNDGAARLYRRFGFVEDGADGGYLRLRWSPDGSRNVPTGTEETTTGQSDE
jgi:GNAT superfamily N-acetyltransferase